MIEEDASDHAHVHITSKEKTRIYKCALISLIGQETITAVSSSSLFYHPFCISPASFHSQRTGDSVALGFCLLVSMMATGHGEY